MPNNPNPTPRFDPVEKLRSALQECALRAKLMVDATPASIANAQLPALELLGTPVEMKPQETTKPSGMFVGQWTTLFGPLDGEAALPADPHPARNAVIERWGRHQHYCAVVRATLNKNRQDDIVLFLTGAIGSEHDKEWNALASQIERDDLVCRKLVWLPPASEGRCAQSLALFLEKTFLARPWQIEGPLGQHRLDAVSDVSDTLTAWQAVLDRQPNNEEDIDYDQLAKELINTHRP